MSPPASDAPSFVRPATIREMYVGINISKLPLDIDSDNQVRLTDFASRWQCSASQRNLTVCMAPTSIDIRAVSNSEVSCSPKKTMLFKTRIKKSTKVSSMFHIIQLCQMMAIQKVAFFANLEK